MKGTFSDFFVVKIYVLKYCKEKKVKICYNNLDIHRVIMTKI